jgi:hypothetical protein
MLLSIVVTLALVTPKQFDQAGRAAFIALRDYQTIEMQHVKAGDAWPTADQRPVLEAKLAVAYECIWDSYRIGFDLDQVHGIMAQPLSLLRAQRGAITAIGNLTGYVAPADAKKALVRLQAAFAVLFGLFPDVAGDYYEHPPK